MYHEINIDDLHEGYYDGIYSSFNTQVNEIFINYSSELNIDSLKKLSLDIESNVKNIKSISNMNSASKNKLLEKFYLLLDKLDLLIMSTRKLSQIGCLYKRDELLMFILVITLVNFLAILFGIMLMIIMFNNI